MAVRNHPGVLLSVDHAAAIVNPYQLGSPALRRPYAVADDGGILLADEASTFRFYLPFERVEEVRFRAESGLFLRLLTGEILYLEVPNRAVWLQTGLRSCPSAIDRSTMG